ncbi:MAG: type II toxin-antitoxin system Phd/YefM family antitoxin [Desulfuromonadaceae bacterium]|nr:type II toxin-antitoxin system Phd/YefM family antitoxin [Desulfuromonadaceae bacterium]
MQTVKFSEDVIPLTDVKINPGKLVKQTVDSHRPMLLTSRGRGVAVLQGVADFEAKDEEHQFMRAIVQGLMDLEEGREISLADVKRQLKLNS